MGVAVTESPDTFTEIARRTLACWMRTRPYLRVLYEQPKVALSLKTQMVKVEAIEALVYGCSTIEITLRMGRDLSGREHSSE